MVLTCKRSLLFWVFFLPDCMLKSLLFPIACQVIIQPLCYQFVCVASWGPFFQMGLFFLSIDKTYPCNIPAIYQIIYATRRFLKDSLMVTRYGTAALFFSIFTHIMALDLFLPLFSCRMQLFFFFKLPDMNSLVSLVIDEV